LKSIEDQGFWERMHPVPAAAWKEKKFHAAQKNNFLKIAGDWQKLSPEMQEQSLAKFLVEKFSTDPNYRQSGAMLPAFRVKPQLASICWNTFWMSDTEKDSLVRSVMAEYRRLESLLFKHSGPTWI
jgi:hypothetical protein